MKKLLVSAATGAAFALAPAMAQTPAQTPDAQPPLEEAQVESATTEIAEGESAIMASLPDEVQDVVESGNYTSEDLAEAQLAAIEAAADDNR